MAKIKFGDGYSDKVVASAREGDVGDAALLLMTLAGYGPTDYGPCSAPCGATREEAEMALRVVASALGFEVVPKD